MSKKIKTLVFSIFVMLFLGDTTLSYSQLINCEYFVPGKSYGAPSGVYRGRVKPNRTTINGDTTSLPGTFFPVLYVFVQFQDDPSYWDWPDKNTNQGKPLYLDSLLAPFNAYNNQSDWWNNYDGMTQMQSDMWMEASRGTFHVLGRAYSVVLSGNRSSYTNEHTMNDEILDSLTAKGVNWRDYDRWRMDQGTGKFYYERDFRVDMIYRIVKTRAPGMHERYGYNCFGPNDNAEHLVDADDTVYVNPWADHLGSGVTLVGHGSKTGFVSGIMHEHGHQTYAGGHCTYSKVSFGVGMEGFMSPNDMVCNEYLSDSVFDFSVNHTLGDYSSRSSSFEGNILRVPIEGNEFFALAFRNKVSYWDRAMTGDTAQLDPFKITNDYGKGLYIYHFNQMYRRPTGNEESFIDLECADGYYVWDSLPAGRHYQTVAPDCFQSGPTDWVYFKKKGVLYDNDSSVLRSPFPIGDGTSFHYQFQDTTRIKWWGIGKEAVDACNLGTDRILVNNTDIYTSKELAGDRWDAWYPGYNEIFSPYSSPSTKAWDNEHSGIFIWFKEIKSGEADLQIWKASEYGGNTSLATILEATPPSRPMFLRDTSCVFEAGQFRPKILWNHNMEPDMERMDQGNSENPVVRKRYKIYRTVSTDLNSVPSEDSYQYIGYTDIDTTTKPYYVDTSAISACYLPQGSCPPYCWIEYRIRYRVTAVDIYNDESVKSDFASTTGIRTESGNPGGEDDDRPTGMSNNTNVPTEFALKQNYPNPFNPSTNIQYDLPRAEFVKIKIYDVLGKEVASLVNADKEAGKYIISFDGSALSSGIYFYKIEAGLFSQIRRMVLIK